MNTIISTNKLIEGLYRLSQDDLVSLWNEYQNDTHQNVKIYHMYDFDDVVSYEEVSPYELMWLVRDRELDPDDKYFYVKRKYVTKVISFDDVFMEGSPIDFYELAEHLIEHIDDIDNKELLNFIEEIKEDDNNHNNNHLEEDDDEDDIPLF